MPKKRKTRQQKEILKLRRKLTQAEIKPARQEANSFPLPTLGSKTQKQKDADRPVFFYDSRLIKKDLFKTLALTGLVFGLELMLYLKLR